MFINSQKGFTLLEAIIYIALFTILITSCFIAGYNLIEGSSSLSGKVRTQEEGGFVTKKISWALSSIDPASTPAIGGSNCSQTLTVNRTETPNLIMIRINTVGSKKYIELQEDGTNYYPLTTENASTTCLKFSSTGSSPIGITSTTTINGVDFVIKKYVRR